MAHRREAGEPWASCCDNSILEKGIFMRSLTTCVRDFLKNEDGPTAVEYAVMLALIIVVCITAITALGTNANATFSSVSNTLGSTAS
jgi:pilus assembly protein Flp/PilA